MPCRRGIFIAQRRYRADLHSATQHKKAAFRASQHKKRLFIVLFQEQRALRKLIPAGPLYRNLALLSERGEILKLSYEGGADHYDACTDPHYHFVCQECGSVIDLDMAPIDEKLNEIASENFPGEITQNVVYFKGICKNCLKKH